MKIQFLGVGEAFDNNLPNNSILIISDKTNLLLDCGYSVPQQWFKLNKKPDFLDVIYISHRHADHFFGLPVLLMRMWEEGRQKPITIICQEGLQEFFKNFLETGYKGFSKKFKYKINFVGVKSGEAINFNDLELSFAKTAHSIENLAVRISNKKTAICYSGDGNFVKETEDLYKDSDLAIQETYLYDKKKIGHASIKDSIEMAERNSIKCLALIHMQRDFRKNILPKMSDKIISGKTKIIIPKLLEEYKL